MCCYFRSLFGLFAFFTIIFGGFVLVIYLASLPKVCDSKMIVFFLLKEKKRNKDTKVRCVFFSLSRSFFPVSFFIVRVSMQLFKGKQQRRLININFVLVRLFSPFSAFSLVPFFLSLRLL